MVVGNLSDPGKNPDGQRINTHQFLAALRRSELVEIVTLDSSRSRATLFFRMWGHLGEVDRVFLLPGKRLLFLAGVFFRLYKALVRPSPVFHLVVIGGWLSRLSSKRIFGWALGAFDSISPETEEIAKGLKSMTPEITVLQNFRVFQGSTEPSAVAPSQHMRLVFLSRVTRSKGVFEAIQLVLALHKDFVPVHLDVFGPLLFDDPCDEKAFHEGLQKTGGLAHYAGLVDPANVISLLRNYDCVLFPSTYEGEGFPGIIVESVLAGTPVIARDHMFLSLLNEKYDFGFVTPGDFVEDTSSILRAGKHLSWRQEWVSSERFFELEELFGYPAFERWISAVLRVTSR